MLVVSYHALHIYYPLQFHFSWTIYRVTVHIAVLAALVNGRTASNDDTRFVSYTWSSVFFLIIVPFFSDLWKLFIDKKAFQKKVHNFSKKNFCNDRYIHSQYETLMKESVLMITLAILFMYNLYSVIDIFDQHVISRRRNSFSHIYCFLSYIYKDCYNFLEVCRQCSHCS